MTETDAWIDRAAQALYQAERVEHPTRQLPLWELAGAGMRADARYRAIAAHLRGNRRVKAVLVEEIARVLADADGYLWPACEARVRPDLPYASYRAGVAERRQRYRHLARLVIAAHNKYLDLDAIAQPEEQRDVILAQVGQQHREDSEAVHAWRRSRGIPNSGHDGDVFGDGRR